MTQLELAKEGIISPQMEWVAQCEGTLLSVAISAKSGIPVRLLCPDEIGARNDGHTN